MQNTIRKIYFLLFCFLSLLAIQCRKNKLPPETQTGDHTFGCLVNGQVFTPKVGILSPLSTKCIYWQSSADYNQFFFKISAYRKVSDCQIKSIVLVGDSLKINVGTYVLGKSMGGKLAGFYEDSNPNCSTNYYNYATTGIDTGMLVIKKFDEISKIVSGTFWFNAVDSSGQLVEVREGRFDMIYR